MTIKTAEQIAQEYADQYAANSRPLERVIADAIEADRAQLYQRVLSFEPDAIIDHFEGGETDPTAGLTTAQLDEIGQGCLQDDRLYRTFHEVLTDALTDYREGNW